MPFTGPFPTIEAFKKVIKTRDFPENNRRILTNVLNQQYEDLMVSGKVKENISALNNPNCITVTTGHQLNIFTGPLFFIYKLVSTVNACKVLKEYYPEHDFVPVYWMASEDHDFAEINHINLFGKQYQWDCNQQGAVGKFNLDGLDEVINQIGECPDLFADAYTNSRNLSEATRKIVNQLFGDHGLMVLDADHPELKKMFIPVMKDDLLNQTAFSKITETNEALEKIGYKTLVTPREINLFYLEDGTRERIVRNKARFEVLGTDVSYSEEELLQHLELHPEHFSPNVVMRTLYQETILPNLAYVGGPGELSYWMQFKSTFLHYHIQFPVLLPRNNALVVNKSLTRKIDKLGLSARELFLGSDALRSAFVERNAKTTLSLESHKKQITQTFREIAGKTREIDGSLTGYILAEENKVLKNLENIEKRLKKAEESNQETAVHQLMGIKEKLFPEGALQERHQNFLNFYINNPRFIEELFDHLDPFDFKFHVLLEDG
jgi:bacillithiol biosynthesis cysteine-adding enzyme BshC